MFLHDQNDQLLDDDELQLKFCREPARVNQQRAKFIPEITRDDVKVDVMVVNKTEPHEGT